jgi:hypothetical protein
VSYTQYILQCTRQYSIAYSRLGAYTYTMDSLIVFIIVKIVYLVFAMHSPSAVQVTPRENIQNQIDNGSIVDALRLLEVSIEHDNLLAKNCHGLAHDIGHKAYELHGLQALNDSNDICGSGYYHGIIEEHFTTTQNILEDFTKVCDESDGRCVHGIGHGLMLALNNNLPEALTYCDRFTTNNKQIQCSEGVFMENFMTDQDIHPTTYRSDDDWFYPCNTITKKLYQAPCTFYSARRVVREYAFSAGLHHCIQVSQNNKVACYRGIGSGAAKALITNLPAAMAACNEVDKMYRNDCYSGMMGYIIVHNASSTALKEICNTFPLEQQELCNNVAFDNEEFYPD